MISIYCDMCGRHISGGYGVADVEFNYPRQTGKTIRSLKNLCENCVGKIDNMFRVRAEPIEDTADAQAIGAEELSDYTGVKPYDQLSRYGRKYHDDPAFREKERARLIERRKAKRIRALEAELNELKKGEENNA